MKHEPPPMEIFLTRLAFFFYGKAVYKTFADLLPLKGNERVLDFGCGMGTVAYYTAQKLPHGHLTCLDISERWLKVCRKVLGNYNNILYLHGDAQLLIGESFDVVYCHFVLHDLSASELARVIPALTKSLKSGGVLVFRDPLRETEKISAIKNLLNESRLVLKDSRITDIPLMGNALESFYIKK